MTSERVALDPSRRAGDQRSDIVNRQEPLNRVPHFASLSEASSLRNIWVSEWLRYSADRERRTVSNLIA